MAKCIIRLPYGIGDTKIDLDKNIHEQLEYYGVIMNQTGRKVLRKLLKKQEKANKKVSKKEVREAELAVIKAFLDEINKNFEKLNKNIEGTNELLDGICDGIKEIDKSLNLKF